MRLHLNLHLVRVDEDHTRLLLVPELDSANFLNVHALVTQLDQLDTDLAPSLLDLLDTAHALTPCYTPAAAYDTIVNLHWCGDDTYEENLSQIRYDLAQDRGVDPDTLTDEEVWAYADEQYLTPHTLETRLPRRYYEPGRGTIKAPELLHRLDQTLFPGALGEVETLIEAADAATKHKHAVLNHELTDWELDEDYFGETMPWYSYMVSITDPVISEANELADVIYEMLCECEQYAYQGGVEPSPSAAYLIPHTPQGMEQLADLTAKLRRQIELEERVFRTLGDLAVEADANAAGRRDR